ncbi:ribonuclease Y [Motilibacter peucedani]|uniref:Ribonuclease Y n=1 Tax=Motilibacter peucedani TaxID=598650 RepID=A0A420XRB4_9ACTN|nr:ribonuclease Y [Motilibacter peucedani]RKS77428.1 ribonuclease Y [Motilibacter peucedani]
MDGGAAEVLALLVLGVVAVLALLALGTVVLRHKAEAHSEATRTAANAAAERAASEAAQQLVAAARAEAAETRERVERELVAARDDLRRLREEVERRERRIGEREDRLEAAAAKDAERQRLLAEREAQLATRAEELHDLEQERVAVLERTAGLSLAEARADLLAVAERAAKRDAVLRVREIERLAQEEGEARAREVVTSAIQRVASEQTTESVVTALHLPSDDLKGRIIGREGRNIRAFEAATGVNLLVDDTPEAVLLSSFDPVRREVARTALEALVLDGRIHPSRIEEAVERAQRDVDQRCLRAAEDALAEVGITEVHPDVVVLLGKLRFRTSYGQNVLRHLVESAHLAGLMAAELGLDVPLLKRGAFLHDIGKALTHEAQGSHALVGAEIAKRYGEEPDVVHAIEAHHNEVEPRTVEAVLVQAADAISGSRPGARREPVEAYVKRLERLEEIAHAHEGVDKVFAMQAGRELRVMVLPDRIDDIQAQVIAREIAKQVEDEMTYPGQIKVVVVRESRAVETAR